MTTTAVIPSVISTDRVSKQYGKHIALADVTLELPEGRVIGLLGPNGAGKTTLLHIMAGLVLPSSGTSRTLGQASEALEAGQLSRLGLVMQEGRFIEWMTVAQHLEFTASFYGTWDHELQRRLIATLQVPLKRKIADLSPGDRQKVCILLGICHRPALLLLDEPMSALDPIARANTLALLLERLREDACTIVISSHLLTDVEKIVDWVVVLEKGRVAESTAFDVLQESFAEWIVTAAPGTSLPPFTESFILRHEGSDRAARILVRIGENDAAESFAARHGVEVKSRPLNLEEMFPLLLRLSAVTL